MKRLDAKIDWISDTLAVLAQSLDAENVKLALRQAEMKLRLRQIYKARRIQPVLVLLTSRTMSDMLHRARYFRQLHLYDARLIGQIDGARARIGVRKAALEAQSAQLAALKTEKQEEQDALAQEQAERVRLLDSVRRQKAAFAATIRELEAEQKQLKNILSALESKHKKGRTEKDRSLLSGFEKQKGSLPWPVEGPVLSEFGRSVHSVYKTVVMNTGIDIKAEKGQTVNCVADGRIAYIGWMRGFGKFAIVDHGGYYSTYAHLDKVAVEADDEVEGGAVLGVVGDPGGEGPPKLHFEVRRSTEALDPREWLERRKR
jgi:septal ring factor EnvC (AmiA/AmiB activator)